MRSRLFAYDAGVEINDERSSSIVDGCGKLGPVPLPADGNNDQLPGEGGITQNHPNIQGVGDLGPAHRWNGPIALVQITPRTSAPTAYSAPAASQVLTTARGQFVGSQKFQVSGTTEVFRQNGQYFIRLGPDFFESGAPDPKVALGIRGAGGYQPGTILGLVQQNGESVYALKPGLDIGNYDQVWIWCERFSVPVGHADLTLL